MQLERIFQLFDKSKFSMQVRRIEHIRIKRRQPGVAKRTGNCLTGNSETGFIRNNNGRPRPKLFAEHPGNFTVHAGTDFQPPRFTSGAQGLGQ